MVNDNNRRISIALLRTLAIVLVILFHFLYNFYPNDSLRYLGFIGISLFFIISGFVLAKKYSSLEKFSLKWFLKRYIKIAVLYYFALIAIVILFSKQVYSGSLLKNLFLNFIFLGFISNETAYGITSAAWFLTPLLGLYILFPYLNRYTKRYTWFLGIIFIATILFRILKGGLTSFSPLFFMGEFCFGIAFAHGKRKLPLLISLLIVFIMPVMFLPFIIFYMLYFLDSKCLPAPILNFIGRNTLALFNFIGRNTLALFLFHEAFINVALGGWHIDQLNTHSALFLLVIISVLLTYLSKEIQNFILSSRYFTGNKKNEKIDTFKFNKNKADLEMKKNLRYLFVIVAIIIIGYFAYAIVTSEKKGVETGEGALSLLKGSMLKEMSKPILVVYNVKTEKEKKGSECYATISGYILNKGNIASSETFIECYPAAFPLVGTKIEKLKKELSSIASKEDISFSITTTVDCKEANRFECKAGCNNC